MHNTQERDHKHIAGPWGWIPSLYFAEALPYVAVMAISVTMYKRLNISNTDIAFYTSWLYLPWVIKPFWSPFVDLIRTKRWWILTMQLLIGASLGGVAFTIPTSHFFQSSLACFWLMAFSSATHDIAADGYYMLELDSHEQSLYVGIRSTFYRIATIAGQGGLLALAGLLETYTRRITYSWSLTFYFISAVFIALTLYHSVFLPRATRDVPSEKVAIGRLLRDFAETVVSFFRKPQCLTALLFMLLYRLPEALLVKMSGLFLIDSVANGGLGLSPQEQGMAQGTIGIIGLTLGGILGGIVAARDGLKKWLWPMVWSLTLPDLVYVLLSYYQTQNFLLISSCFFIEQFGYGFGFTAYMLFLLYYARGARQTTHYALCTGFMALSMMLPGMVAGWLQEQVGYFHFFLIVMSCCLVTIGVTTLLKIDPDFGKKGNSLKKR
ncbi:MAG: MFS transporter [Paraprevotella sp.]|nr:MFS transporter [Paraprevotella sp.]